MVNRVGNQLGAWRYSDLMVKVYLFLIDTFVRVLFLYSSCAIPLFLSDRNFKRITMIVYPNYYRFRSIHFKQFYLFGPRLDQCQSMFDFLAETRNYFWLSLPVHSGSLKRIDYPKQICLAHPLYFECFHCS